MMHGRGKSDSAIVATKPTNKVGQPTAEPVERRAEAKGNADQQRTCRAQNRESVSHALDRIRQAIVLPSNTQGGSRMREIRTYGSGAARLAAILAGESPANRRSSGHCCSYIQRQEGRPTCWKPGSKSPLRLGRPGLIRHRRASNLTGRSVSESGSPEIRALRETDCRINGSAELFRSWRRPCSASEN